jgi:formylglycine-generating enzyme required for sulfatase activity
MSSLADLPELVGFFSYSRKDDEHSQGALSRLRARIQSELRLQLGRDFRLWQDTAAIPDGALWEDEIKRAVAESVFFIPIVTPSGVGSAHCKFEFQSFLERELVLGRNDLIFPILYIRVAALESEAQWRQDDLLKIIGSRQYTDWQKFRHRDVTSPEIAEKIEQFCRNILGALHRPWISPQERRRAEEAEARERVEETRRREGAAKAERRAEVERHKNAETEARERAEEERTEEASKKEEAEAKRRTEEERRTLAEIATRRRAEEEKAFEAVKRADDVGAVDKLLADYPESHLADEARALRAMLSAREEAYRRANESDDPAVLKAFLETYSKGALADQARRKLRRLEPQQGWRPSRPALLIGGVLLISAIGVWLVVASLAPVVTAPPSVRTLLTDGAPLSSAQEQALKSKDAFKECADCPEMIVVPAGSFKMGSPDSEMSRSSDESPQHSVTFARQFAVGRFAVTFDEWDACVAEGGCGGYRPVDQFWGRGRRPVINVSWDDAKAYVAWISKKTGKTYRLLSEAEREYVTRAGTTSPFWWGSSISTSQANYDGRSTYGDGPKGEFLEHTVPVDSFQPNPWGLFQVHGNLYDMVEDCYHDSYRGAPSDGSAWTSGDCGRRVVRGGSWLNIPLSLRSAFRFRLTARDRGFNYGLRIGRTLTP